MLLISLTKVAWRRLKQQQRQIKKSPLTHLKLQGCELLARVPGKSLLELKYNRLSTLWWRSIYSRAPGQMLLSKTKIVLIHASWRNSSLFSNRMPKEITSGGRKRWLPTLASPRKKCAACRPRMQNQKLKPTRQDRRMTCSTCWIVLRPTRQKQHLSKSRKLLSHSWMTSFPPSWMQTRHRMLSHLLYSIVNRQGLELIVVRKGCHRLHRPRKRKRTT